MQKKIYIHIESGMGNRILPLISAIRLAHKTDRKLYIYWGCKALGRYVETKHVKKWTERPHKFTDFFENDPSLFTQITKQQFEKEKNGKSCKRYTNSSTHTSVITQSDLKRFDVLWFNRIWYPLALDSDDITGYIPYPRSLTPISSGNYILSLRKYAGMLKVAPDLKQKIKEQTEQFPDNVIGVHIRSTNGGFLKKRFTHLIPLLDTFLIQNPNYKIFLAADTQSRENEFKLHFKDKLIVYNEPINGQQHKRSNTVAGVKNGMIDMFLLSKCTKLIGTGESSFSFMAWIFGNASEYKVHTH